MGGSTNSVGLPSEKMKRGSVQAFPRKLLDIINSEHESVIAWSESGDQFFIYDPDRFAKEVLPKYFRHGHYSSFQRQLNLYGFRRLGSETKTLGYQHDDFNRYHPERVDSIRRSPQWSNAKELRKQKALAKQMGLQQPADHETNSLKRKNPYSGSKTSKKPVTSIASYTPSPVPLPPAKVELKPSQQSLSAPSLSAPLVDVDMEDWSFDGLDWGSDDWKDCLDAFKTPGDLVNFSRQNSFNMAEESLSSCYAAPVLRRDTSSGLSRFFQQAVVKTEKDVEVPPFTKQLSNSRIFPEMAPSGLEELPFIDDLKENMGGYDIRDVPRATLSRNISLTRINSMRSFIE
mmetsp:Transcript_5527/g.9908  ORF Transcript_5527/g.9908 Transcript_5527/m.9908 type:complete len:345 (-) Transcript_5527:56-1090(-)